jgi:hypothetical protein
MSGVKITPYKAELRGCEMCDVLDDGRCVWLSVAVEYCNSVHNGPQHVWVVKALSSLVL